MVDRCEPPEELRGVDGWYWVAMPPHMGGATLIFWSKLYGEWSHKNATYSGVELFQRGWRYLAPVATPATVAALVDALIQAEACMSIVVPRSDMAEYRRILGVVRAALAAYRRET